MSAAHATAAKVSTTNRSRVTNDPRYVAGASGRTPGGRRRRDLVNCYVAALGGIDAITSVQAADVRRAAELSALAEEVRATALREGVAAIDISALVRLEGQAARAVKALGIGCKREPQGQDMLQAYLATSNFQVPDAGDDAEHEPETPALEPESTPIP